MAATDQPAVVALGDTITGADGSTAVVAASCGDSGGNWYCVTHRQGFAHNMSKDSHLGDDPAAHVLAWVCRQHGAEVP